MPKPIKSERTAAFQFWTQGKKQCWCCNAKQNTNKNKDKIQLHHIRPRSLGGNNEPHNLLPLCDDCHKKSHYLYSNSISHHLGKLEMEFFWRILSTLKNYTETTRSKNFDKFKSEAEGLM